MALKTAQMADSLLKELTETSAPRTKARQINIKDWEKFLEFDTFGDKQLEGLIGCCARFSWRIKDGEPPSWLTILGDSGTGKTHCARKIWDWAKRKFTWTKSSFIEEEIYWPELVGRLRDTEDRDAKEKLKDIAKWPVLFIDDIGAERDKTGYSSDLLNTLMGQRVNRWTIITSNLPLHKIAEVDVRISDRIIRERGNEMIEIEGLKSYALRKSQPGRSVLPSSDRD